MNIATTDPNIKVLKCRHGEDYYKYLCKLTPSLWAVLVYDETDENQVWECVYFSEKDALYAYNHYKNNETFRGKNT